MDDLVDTKVSVKCGGEKNWWAIGSGWRLLERK